MIFVPMFMICTFMGILMGLTFLEHRVGGRELAVRVGGILLFLSCGRNCPVAARLGANTGGAARVELGRLLSSGAGWAPPRCVHS